MTASFPSSVKKFTPVVDNASEIQATDVNQAYEEIAAIEAWLQKNLSRGMMLNGKLSVTVASNNLTVALKTLADADPSATDPVYVRIGDVVHAITAALSVTVNAGTNWCNAGSAELATKEIDWFPYLTWNTSLATPAVDILVSRIPYANLFSEFSATSTNEKYACRNATAPAATDTVEVIGRFAATLSAGAGYTWTVPTFTAANLINRPIYTSRILSFVPAVTYAGGTTDPTSCTIDVATYYRNNNSINIQIQATIVRGSGNRTQTNFSIPFTFATVAVPAIDSITGSIKPPTAAFVSGTSVAVVETMSSDGTYYITINNVLS